MWATAIIRDNNATDSGQVTEPRFGGLQHTVHRIRRWQCVSGQVWLDFQKKKSSTQRGGQFDNNGNGIYGTNLWVHPVRGIGRHPFFTIW